MYMYTTRDSSVHKVYIHSYKVYINYALRSLLQNIVSFIGLFCKRALKHVCTLGSSVYVHTLLQSLYKLRSLVLYGALRHFTIYTCMQSNCIYFLLKI